MLSLYPRPLGSGAFRRVPVARAAGLVLVAGALACHDGRLTAPARGHLAIESGNAQRGSPGQPLELPLVATVHDASGAPTAGVTVSWIADDGGTIAPPTSITDAQGSVSATWTLGIDPSFHRARAVADGYEAIAFTASTDPLLPLDVIQSLALRTFDGSGQTVHPDYVAVGPEWTHADRYLVLTPYPNGNPNYENPSIYQSADLVDWTAPDGVVNPIDAPVTGYDSDPDALYVPEQNELWLYFRQVTDENVIRLTKSRDGVHWSLPVTVAHAPDHEIISPTVVRRAPDEWLMWSVNGNVGCGGPSTTVELRRSSNGVDWSPPETVELTQPGVFPWHIDVEWVQSRGEFWALYNAKTAGSCTTPAVYLATSTDGVHWITFPSPVLARGANDALRDVVYRSTFAYDPGSDAITLWYSGARYEAGSYIWRSAVQRRLRADLFATVNSPARAATAAPVALPPLTNFP